VLWRGGAPVGMVVHEFFSYKGIELRQIVIKAGSYSGIGKRGELSIEGMDDVLSSIKVDDKILVVDDIYDTGNTLKKVRELLLRRTQNIRIATLYLKKGHDKGPDYYIREVKNWLVFPHELLGLSPAEIRRKDKYIHSLIV